MKTTQHSRRGLITVGSVLAAAMMLLAQAHNLNAQWSGTTNIYYNAGNVGIGTMTPGYSLDVGSGGTVRLFPNVDDKAVSFSIVPNYNLSNTINMYMGTHRLLNTVWTTNALSLQPDGGNVGIGTTSPGSALEVSVAVPIITIKGSTNNAFRGLSLKDGSTEIATLQSNANSGELRQTAGFATFGGFQTFHTNGLERVRIDSSGNVGIGKTADISYKLDVAGNINSTSTITGNSIIAKYQDVAEWVPASEQLAAGTVVVLDSTKSNQVTSSSVSYDTRVAGVVSAQPGIALGEKSDTKVLVATTGRVRVKVDASKGAIHIGDLLVTSDIPGVAMKSEPITIGNRKMHMPGTLIGKALEPLEKGSGKILVLLSLQ
jgi:hypothetical protein